MSTTFVTPKQDFPFFYVNCADDSFPVRFGFVHRPFTTWDNYNGASSFAGPGKGRLILRIEEEITAEFNNEEIIVGALYLEDGSRVTKETDMKKGNHYYFKKF
ncbi:MAG: hypothetical protein IKH67_01690 [Lachnospiraceae bacterium]|nr:hypothetical protein [Lachnospiraceae bacterium]